MGGGKFENFVVGIVGLVVLVGSVSGIGVNWGTQSTHPLSPSNVVKMLKDNGIQKVKLFDADPGILDALKKSGIQVMVGIPNDMLYTLANSVEAAEKWVSKNVSKHVSSGGVDIRYIKNPFFMCWERICCYQPLALSLSCGFNCHCSCCLVWFFGNENGQFIWNLGAAENASNENF